MTRLRGFTLVEVLIALVLLSLLMLALTGALRAMGQTEERVEQRIAVADDYRAAVHFLGDVLGQVSARRFATQQADAPSQTPFFQAAPDALAWIGVMPARHGLGGRHYMRLGVEPGPNGGQLVLRYAPWTGAPTFSAWDQAAAQILAGLNAGEREIVVAEGVEAGALELRRADPATLFAFTAAEGARLAAARAEGQGPEPAKVNT